MAHRNARSMLRRQIRQCHVKVALAQCICVLQFLGEQLHGEQCFIDKDIFRNTKDVRISLQFIF